MTIPLSSSHTDNSTLQKMSFVYNALQDGWMVKKVGSQKYEFKKSHESAKELVLDDNYLLHFVQQNLDVTHLLESIDTQT